MQSKWIRLCLRLDKMHHISEEEFKLINWLPTSKRFDQYINAVTYNFVNETCPYFWMKFLNSHHIVGWTQEIASLNLKILLARQAWNKKQSFILVPLFETACLTALKTRIVEILSNIMSESTMTWIINNVFMRICVSVFIYVCMSASVCIYTHGYILVCFPLTYPFPCFFFSVTLFSHFSSNSRDHNENKAFLLVLLYPSHCWCYSYLSAVIFQLQLSYFNF